MGAGSGVEEVDNGVHGDPPIQLPEPEPLFNPYNDGAEPAYVRIDTPDGITFRYAREVQERDHGDNIYGPWGSKKEWDDAYWFATTKTTQAGLQEMSKHISTHQILRSLRR